jgi:hypothetical protein
MDGFRSGGKRMKHKDYEPYYIWICSIMMLIAFHQCDTADSIRGVENELKGIQHELRMMKYERM